MKKIKKLSAVLADDYEIFRRQFKKQLAICKQYEIQVVGEADNGVAALEIVQQTKPDILFTDIRMPKMDGMSLLEQVKNENLCKFIVLLSEYTDFEYARKGIVLSAFDYLVKPVQIADIENLLERICKQMETDGTPDTDRYKEKEIVNGIINRENYIEGYIDDFIEHYKQKLYSSDLVSCTLKLSEALDRITKHICNVYEWAINILPPFSYQNEMLGADNAQEMLRKAQLYLKSIYETLLYYYPKNISGVSEKAVNYVLQHPHQRVTLSDISDICGVSYAYLSHCFKTEIRVSFIDYYTHYKMDIAKMLLRTTDMNIMSIADKLRYDDYKYMGRIFKNVVGMSPSEYRRKND